MICDDSLVELGYSIRLVIGVRLSEILKGVALISIF